MTGMASPEKASSSKKKGERKCASKEEYRQLSGIMAVMNNLRKQVCHGDKNLNSYIQILGVFVRC